MKMKLILLSLVLSYCTFPAKENKNTSVEEEKARGRAEISALARRYPGLGDTPVYKITVSLDAKFWEGNTVFYQVNDVNGSGLVHTLFDEQEADPLHNKKDPEPKSTFTSGYSTRVYYPARAVIDLGGYYKLRSEEHTSELQSRG